MSVPTTDSQMYQTIHRQPEDVRRLLAEGWGPAAEAAGKLDGARRVFVVGIGTSYHASLMGAWLLRSAGADARAISSFDFAHYPGNFPITSDDAVIIMSHSGVKTYSQESLQRATGAGATVISVGSLTAEHPGSELILRTTEREKSAAFTSSHLSAMTVLAQVATELGERSGAAGTQGYREALGRLPEQVEDILSREEQIRPISEAWVDRQVYATGAGPNELSAIEAVIKVREAAYGRIDALALEQFLHGPIVSFNEGDGAIVVNVAGASERRVGEVAAVLASLGGDIWVVGKAIDGLPAAKVFDVPETLEDLSPLLTVIPMQLYAYFMAAAKGVHPDTFRRDNPRYNEAFGLLKL